MTGSLEHNLRLLAAEGVMISIWPTRSGMFQANVSEQGDKSWTCDTQADPLIALNNAMRYRLTSMASRTNVRDPMPEQIDRQQIDIEEAIADAVERDEEDLIG